MKNALTASRCGGFVVFVVLQNGEPWWVASDVAKLLGYRDAANMIRNIRDKHKGAQNVSTPGGNIFGYGASSADG